MTVFQRLCLSFSSRQVAYATSGEYTSCTEFTQRSRYTYIYIYIYSSSFFFLASYLYPKIYISQFTRVVFTLLTRMSLHRDVFVTIKRRFNSFKSMQHSLTNGSLKALSIYTDLPMIPLFRILTLIQNIDHFIKTKYNRESRYFGSR